MPVDYSKFDNIDTDSEDEAAPAAAAQNSAATPRLVTPQSTKKEGLPPPPQAKPSVPATPARRSRPAAPAPASDDFSSTAALVDGLALASTCAEVAKGANTEEALAAARGFVYRLFELHTLPLVLDEQGWANPWALAARTIGKRAAASANKEVAFLGVGSLVPAMAAAKAGASVTVYGRVRRLLEVAAACAKKNKVGRRVRVVRCKKPFAQLDARAASGAPFAAVFAEGFDDGLLGHGTLAALARNAAAGTCCPSRAAFFVAPAELRTTKAAALDVSLLNAHRGAAASPSAAALARSNDVDDERRGSSTGRLLAPPALVFEWGFPGGGKAATGTSLARAEVEVRPYVCTDGVLNAAVGFFVLELAEGIYVTTAPARLAAGIRKASSWAGAVAAATDPAEAAGASPAVRGRTRFRRQLVSYAGFEAPVARGESRAVVARHDGRAVSMEVRKPAGGPEAGPAGGAEEVLLYHYPMVADEGRNGAYDAAIRSALKAFAAKEKRSKKRPARQATVLDVGGGTGLLSMMAARAGAGAVHCVEVVPAMAATAEKVVAANGLADAVTVHAKSSFECWPGVEVPERADVVVAEVFDNGLLGEDALAALADAVSRLAKPGAAVVPRGAQLFACALDLATPNRAGLDLSAFDALRVDAAHGALESACLRLQSTDHRKLSKAVPTFGFDFTKKKADETGHARLRLEFVEDGTFSAIAQWWALDMAEGVSLSTAPDATPECTGWDHPITYLAQPLAVKAGDVVELLASHDGVRVSFGLGGVSPEMSAGSGPAPPKLPAPRPEGSSGAASAPKAAGPAVPPPPMPAADARQDADFYRRNLPAEEADDEDPTQAAFFTRVAERRPAVRLPATPPVSSAASLPGWREAANGWTLPAGLLSAEDLERIDADAAAHAERMAKAFAAPHLKGFVLYMGLMDDADALERSPRACAECVRKRHWHHLVGRVLTKRGHHAHAPAAHATAVRSMTRVAGVHPCAGTFQRSVWCGWGESLEKAGDLEGAGRVHAFAVERGAFAHPWQRPEDIYCRHLACQAFWDPSQIPACAALQAAYRTIKAEAAAAAAAAHYSKYDSSVVDDGEWSDIQLYYNAKRHVRNCAKCPKTAALVANTRSLGTYIYGGAFFSRLAPGTHLAAHCGPSNARLRIHLGLDIPPGCRIRVGSEVREWKEGECLVFDDSVEHEVWIPKDTGRGRVVLIADCWHPDLTEEYLRKLCGYRHDDLKAYDGAARGEFAPLERRDHSAGWSEEIHN